MAPSKLELLTSWLPAQPWYQRTGRLPQLRRSGGFRLDDPAGEVGIEFLVVTDGTGPDAVSYQVPLTYRGAARHAAEHALIGTAMHGVLGQRWVYDGAHDPALAAQLLALIRGTAQPQAQSASDTPDRTVAGHSAGSGLPAMRLVSAASGPDGTDMVLTTEAGSDPDNPAAELARICLTRVLEPGADDAAAVATGARGYVTAPWTRPDGAKVRGVFAVLRAEPPG